MPEPFSLLMAVYAGDDPRHFRRAFRSTVDDQTRPPAEVVIVQDGPVSTELAEVLAEVVESSEVPVVLERMPVNRGLAEALRIGLERCRHEIVARMDADDVSLPERFERQMRLVEDGHDLVGTGMLEFLDDDGAIVGRRVPRTGAAIADYARFHDPFNHPTVVFRREAVQRAGGYRPLGRMEDYWLFARMLHTGAVAENLVEPLLMYRVGSGAYTRRGGRELWRSEVLLQRALRRIGFTTRTQFIRNVLVRGGYRFVPETVRRAMYRRFIAAGGGER
jgi:glycosyltransferase involved in cell wall biosynthesis